MCIFVYVFVFFYVARSFALLRKHAFLLVLLLFFFSFLFCFCIFFFYFGSILAVNKENCFAYGVATWFALFVKFSDTPRCCFLFVVIIIMSKNISFFSLSMFCRFLNGTM